MSHSVIRINKCQINTVCEKLEIRSILALCKYESRSAIEFLPRIGMSNFIFLNEIEFTLKIYLFRISCIKNKLILCKEHCTCK